MAEFLTSLQTVNLEDNRWQLLEPLVYESDIVGRVVVPGGFRTDFASVPRVPIAYWCWGGRCHHEAVIHDYLFRLGAKPDCTFAQANDVFLEAMEARGKSAWVRYPMWLGVQFSGHLWKTKGVEWTG